ncbi:Predicted Zn-dependent peptidase [Balnearium lithotrophicum]|uniref:Predicted Zn-dependent peptidase n=1 Tax=Balnearium lithotrophicum TaxID=223788 RepID=A0A521CBZ4_9BACT|nr:pitrilysin family protein [Balnearium lithotrophicum]SMO56875.1 Predicted Zn-dependent peptidase [Balnearium lithotrophicum]
MEVFQLSNGIRVILKPERELEIVSGNLFFPIGNSFDPKGKEGITLLTLKTAVKRSLKRKPEEFYRIQEEIGAPFVSDVSLDYSLVRFQSTSKDFLNYGELLLETLLNPGFTEESFSVEKEALLASIKSKKESPFTLAYEKMMELTYSQTPYQNLPYGSEGSVSSLDLETCKDWYKGFLIPKGSVLSLCGNLQNMEKFLGDVEKIESYEFKRERFEKRITESKTEFVRREGSAQTFILIALNAPSVKSDFYIKYKLLNTILGEGIGSVLFQELREKEGFAYSTGSLYPSRLNTGRILIYIGTSPDKRETVRKKLRSILRQLPSFINSDSIERAKEYFKGTYLLDHETRSKKSWYLGFWEILEKGYKFDSEFLRKIEEIKLSEIKNVAEIVSAEPIHEVVVGDEEVNS